MSPRKPPNWAAIEAEYLAGGVSYQALADKHGVSKRTVERRGIAGDWGSRSRQVVGAVSASLPGRIADGLAELAADDAIMSREEVLRRLTSIARGGMRRVATWGAGGVVLRESDALSDEDSALVSEVAETVNAFGTPVRIKVQDPLSALKELARFHGIDQPAAPATDDPQEGVVILDDTSEGWLDG